MSTLDDNAKRDIILEKSVDSDKALLEEERGLIEGAKRGDQLSFKKLMDKYKSQVGGLAYRMVGSYEDARDISQNVFIKAYQNLGSFDTKRKFSTWLYRIAMNASIDYLRKYRKHKTDHLDDLAGQLSDKKDGPEKVFNNTLVKLAVRDSLESLNSKQKSVFVLRDLEGLDINEIAQITQMPQATVRWYLHRARAKLKGELIKHHPLVLKRMGVRL
ncbi:MAG TPA: sigma-70 family RNA polymerase sigma factor [candidate division Zixibacteria bacterium]